MTLVSSKAYSDFIPIETEVMVHGYIPLALSARCFTARALDLPKDQCKRKCIDYIFILL